MQHPGKELIEEIRNRGRTQKEFALLASKKVSEVNELIKWKRNITIQRDIILADVLWSPEKFRLNKQINYDYSIAKNNFQKNKKKPNKSGFQNTDHENIFQNF